MNRRWSGLRPLKRWAIALLLSLAAVVAVWMVRQELSSEDRVIVPDVVGMRLDEARLRLSLLGIHGPGERDENGEPFPEGTPDLETITRVRDLSPPPGSSISRDDPDLTLYLEFCNGRCEPTATPPVEPETGRDP
jgi:beta-lactam-binding protein with PASTA domain